MKETNSNDNYDAQTLILNDSNGNEIFCYLEQLVSVEGQEYALLTPVDTPVSLFKINEKDEPELIDKIDKNEQILKNAEAVLQEHDLRLIRSAVTLTVSGELEEPIYDELKKIASMMIVRVMNCLLTLIFLTKNMVYIFH